MLEIVKNGRICGKVWVNFCCNFGGKQYYLAIIILFHLFYIAPVHSLLKASYLNLASEVDPICLSLHSITDLLSKNVKIKRENMLKHAKLH